MFVEFDISLSLFEFEFDRDNSKYGMDCQGKVKFL